MRLTPFGDAATSGTESSGVCTDWVTSIWPELAEPRRRATAASRYTRRGALLPVPRQLVAETTTSLNPGNGSKSRPLRRTGPKAPPAGRTSAGKIDPLCVVPLDEVAAIEALVIGEPCPSTLPSRRNSLF